MTSSPLETVLDRLYFSATSEREKGDAFERLMLKFFTTDVAWSARFSTVWMWQDWPGRDGAPDTGVDLVAEDSVTGDVWAIQCKFYDPRGTISREDIDRFLVTSGREPFAHRLLVSTTDQWGRNAEHAVREQRVPVQRLRFQDLADSSIDWSQFDVSTPDVMELRERKRARPHQVEAIAAVRRGLAGHDRGKLVMACGTGKTFTALKLAEQMLPTGGSVLFLVPSISLLSQTLREWGSQAELPQRQFAVCSDVRAGARRAGDSEDVSTVDLPIPATTDAGRLRVAMDNQPRHEGSLTVVFATYQSIDVVIEAQSLGLEEFDLVVCDEAHRTTGVTLSDGKESPFLRVHDAGKLRAAKRLYMTATPRVYDDATQTRGRESQAVLATMDDESTFGPELHRLGFGAAVDRGLLTDYKVLVLAVDEQSVSRTFQSQLAADGELGLDDVARVVGCWNGLAKAGLSEKSFETDPRPMRRAVAFARSIKDSKAFAEMFRDVVDQYAGDAEEDESFLDCSVDHVDGTYNVLSRNQRLDWLEAPLPDGECRILSNARCLSEGVDVPALDAVMFLNPRRSQVDVIQSVGRVMRRSPGKKFGYVILPIGIPSDRSPEEALRDNDKYRVVWEVLQALRAHDDRFDASINTIDLNESRDDRLQIIGVGGSPETTSGASEATQLRLAFPQLEEWRDAIYAKIVAKVGSRRYWESWASDVADIADQHRTRIAALLEDEGSSAAVEFASFLDALRRNLNDSITEADAVDMLSQHLITRPIFDALFEGYSFTRHNPVAKVMEKMLAVLDENRLHAGNDSLEGFYDSVRTRVAGIDNAAGKQKVVVELYEQFFRLAFAKTAASLGIVYTPTEIVDFILRAADHVLRTELGSSIGADGVHVLDPFTGTGTFVVRLLQSGLIDRSDLARAYTRHLHANEILLLAYYIACVNIETTYADLVAGPDDENAAGKHYEPFPGAVLIDTFQMSEDDDPTDLRVFQAWCHTVSASGGRRMMVGP